MCSDYKYVPWQKGFPKRRPLSAEHDRFSGWCGRFTCELTTKTPLCIKTWNPNRPIIPGSSLKGMIRAVAEAVSQACAPVGDYVGDFYPCKHHAQACPCCRLFGGIFPGEESGGYQSKVYFSNTKPIGLVQATPINVDTFHQNLPDLELKRGRRFFAHRAFTQGSQFPVYAVPPEKRFQFEIEFAGLDDDELGLLLYSLVLEPDMAHKLGFMKSRGLGSVKLTIVKVDCTNNYRSFYDGFDATISGMPLENKQQIDNLVNPKIQAYLQKNGLTNSAQVNTLRTILQYAP